MRKLIKLGLFGLFLVLIFALVFIGFHLLNAQPKGKPKPVVYWTVKIPTSWDGIDNMLVGYNGPDYEYRSNNTDYVGVEKKSYREKGNTGFAYILSFKIFTPNSVRFQYLTLDPYTTPDPDYNPCSFPDPCNCTEPQPPYCMECFLEQWQPIPGSGYYIHIGFTLYDFDIEHMEYEKVYNLSGIYGNYSFIFYNQLASDCSLLNKDRYHHLLALPNLEYDAEIGRSILANLSIQRIGQYRWRILVDKRTFTLDEYYCEQYSPSWIFRTPLRAHGNFTYIMEWIKYVQ